MIALILDDRCDGCNACVEVCPTLVFEEGPASAATRVPVIANPDACQTCYLCELYCQSDAIYVAPDQFARQQVTAQEVLASGQLGKVRQDSGWNGDGFSADLDVYRLLGPYLGQGAETATARRAAGGKS